MMKLIAEGWTAEVYAGDNGRIVKLLRPNFPASMAEAEAQLTLTIQSLGVKVPGCYGVVEHEGRAGIEYERIEGTTLIGAIQPNPIWVHRKAREFAQLHADMHNKTTDALPDQRERLKRNLDRAGELNQSQRAYLFAMVDQLPNENSVCHGDFHPGNVMLSADGMVTIDWIDATRGCRQVDVARTMLLLNGPLPKDDDPLRYGIINAVRHLFMRNYFNHYCHLQKVSKAEVKRLLPLVAGARLAENIPEERERLLRLVTQATNNRN